MRLLAVMMAVIWLWPLAEAQSKKAFVVGIGDYEELTDLQKTIGDVRGYADVFGGTLGFEVTKLENPSLLEFDIAFTAFLETVGAGDDVVFIFSGHGWSDGAENYLAPADAPRAAPEAFVKRSTIALNSFVLAELRKRRPNLSFAIIDACRDNPFDTGTRSAFEKGLARVSAGEGELILYSAGSLQKSLDRLSEEDTSPYSVFTRILLPKLSDPSVPLAQIADEARSEVQKLADTIDHRQRPEMMLGVSLGYCLAGECRREGEAPKMAPDVARWLALTGGEQVPDICAAYEGFIEAYPASQYVSRAERLLQAPPCVPEGPAGPPPLSRTPSFLAGAPEFLDPEAVIVDQMMWMDGVGIAYAGRRMAGAPDAGTAFAGRADTGETFTLELAPELGRPTKITGLEMSPFNDAFVTGISAAPGTEKLRGFIHKRGFLPGQSWTRIIQPGGNESNARTNAMLIDYDTSKVLSVGSYTTERKPPHGHVAAFDALGESVWDVTLTGKGYVELLDGVVAANGEYWVTGTSDHGVYLARLSTDGEIISESVFSPVERGASLTGTHIANASDGGAWIVGSGGYRGEAGSRIVLVRLDSSGSRRFQKRLDYDGRDYAVASVESDVKGGLWLSGTASTIVGDDFQAFLEFVTEEGEPVDFADVGEGRQSEGGPMVLSPDRVIWLSAVRFDADGDVARSRPYLQSFHLTE